MYSEYATPWNEVWGCSSDNFFQVFQPLLTNTRFSFTSNSQDTYFAMMSSNGIRLTQSLHSPIQTPDSDVIQPVTLRRIRSLELPSVGQPLQGKSNLRVKTQSESLMFQWRSSNLKTSRRLDWKDVHIRKYERTVGDNPSCRSGPPLRWVLVAIVSPWRSPQTFVMYTVWTIVRLTCIN